MPQSYLKKIAKKHNLSIERVEHLWKKAKHLASEQGQEEKYPYIMGIFKNMVGEENEEILKKQLLPAIEEEFNKYAQRHGSEYTATHLKNAKAVIAVNIARKFNLRFREAQKYVEEFFKEQQVEEQQNKFSLTFKQFLYEIEEQK